MDQIAYHPAAWARHLGAGLLALVAGVAVQLQQAELWGWPIYAGIMALAPAVYALLATKRIAHGGSLIAVVLVALILGFAQTGLRAAVYARGALDPALEGRDVRVTGVVAQMPQRSEAGLRFRLEIEAATLDHQALNLPPLVDVGWYGGTYTRDDAVLGLNRLPAELRAGERWQMTLRLKAPHGSRNPHGFDYELWLWEQGVQATGYVRAGAQDVAPQRLGQTWQHPVALARQWVRERIYAQVVQRQWAGMVAALVVGDQSAIDRVDWDVFRATGVAHLVSISGLHITMFAWGAALCLGWLWRRSGRLCLAFPAPSAALLGGVLLAGAYAVFSGWGVPAQRTCLMLTTVGLLRLSGARWPWPLVWLLACAVVVLADPYALLQAGFWLSFVAVGVLFTTDLGAAHAGSTGLRAQKHPIFSGLREQWVITVALAPLTLLLFGQVSLVGLVANVLAVPWMTLVVTPLAMLGVLLPDLWDVAAGALGCLLVYLQWLATWPGATLTVAMPPLWLGVLGAVGGVVLVAPWPWSLRALGVPLVISVLLWRAPLPPPGQFELLAADIGQGNAVLVRTASHALLYDTGPRYSLESDAGHRVLVPLLQALDVRLDTVVLSHRDIDHVGGAAAVLAMQPQATLLSSVESEHSLQKLRPAQRCVAGQEWDWDGVHFSVLHPLAADYDAPRKPNAVSCVVRISNGARTALLVGDIEKPQETRLVADGAPLRSDVLLMPHHGSKTSSSPEFLDAVAPGIAIAQAGYRSRFGHPNALVLERYRTRGVQVVDSPHCGAFTWRSWREPTDSPGTCYRDLSRRYWHHRVPAALLE